MPALENTKHEAFLLRWLEHTKPIAECYLETVAEPDKPLKPKAAIKAAAASADH